MQQAPRLKSEASTTEIVSNENKTLIYIRAYVRVMFIEMFCLFCVIFFIGSTAMFLGNGTSNVVVTLCNNAVFATFVMISNGSHLNPAVTIALTCIGECGIVQAIALIIAQLLGSVLGAVALDNAQPDQFEGNLGYPSLAASLKEGQGFFYEFIASFTLLFVVVYTIRTKRSVEMTAVFVFLVLTFLLPAMMFLTGASMNPARTFGPWIIKENRFVRGWWIYYTATILGAIVGAAVTKFLLFYDGFDEEWLPPKIADKNMSPTNAEKNYIQASNVNTDRK